VLQKQSGCGEVGDESQAAANIEIQIRRFYRFLPFQVRAAHGAGTVAITGTSLLFLLFLILSVQATEAALLRGRLTSLAI